ncbi:MAG: antitoxin Xre/MbcA/ParS toxin-binding domain-containing protein [Persicimonas sp.]
MAAPPRVSDILSLEPSSPMEERIREGFSPQSIEALQDFLQVSQEELASALGVTRQTLIRNKRRGKLLSPRLSDQVHRVARVTRKALQVFDDRESAVGWLKDDNATLGGRAPLRLLDTDAGVEKVEHLLGRIEWGVYS